MEFDLDQAIAVLARTPAVLQSMLYGLPAGWTSHNEGQGTWSPYDVVGHLIHAERTNWIPRAKHILDYGENGRSIASIDQPSLPKAGTARS